jgi:hypothetical protein
MDRTVYIDCLQTVWSVILQKLHLPSPHAVILLSMKNYTVVSIWLAFAFTQWKGTGDVYEAQW